jgi:hypothetical protein
MHVDIDEPVVVDRQEVFQIVSTPAPPVIDVAVLKPAEAQANVDGRDESLAGQRLLRGCHHPGFQAPLAVRLHEGDDQPTVTSLDGTMVTGNGVTARYSSWPVT